MWINVNPNPRKRVGTDCVIRALCFAFGMSWYEVYDDLYLTGRQDCDWGSNDEVWGHYLMSRGCTPVVLPKACPRCMTILEFTKRYPSGIYIIGTGNHAVTVIDGDYYDSWDSGNEIASFFWKVPEQLERRSSYGL